MSDLNSNAYRGGLSKRGSVRLLVKLAARNLKRDLRRSLITVSAVSLGLALFIFSDALQEGSYQSLIRVGVSTQAGHLVLQRNGYRDRPKQALYLDDVSTLSAQVKETLTTQNISAVVTPRAMVAGVLQSAAGSARAMLIGVDPELEPRVSEWHKRLAPAPLPAGERGDPLESAWLKRGDARGVLLGALLARRLDVTVGDKLVYTFERDGEVESLLLRLRGVLKLGSEEQEAQTAIVTISGASAVLNARDDRLRAHQLTVHLSDLRELSRARGALIKSLDLTETPEPPKPPESPKDSEKPEKPEESEESKIAKRSTSDRALPHDQNYELLEWREALPALYQFSIKDRQNSRVIFLLMGIIIAIGVLNTIAMSALERRRQFGVMMALGLTPRLIGSLIVIEGFILGLIASLLGMIVGALIVWPLVEYGLDLGSMMGEGMEIGGVFIETRIFGVWHLKGLLELSVASLVLCTLASLYPAWRTARLEALSAMRGADAPGSS